MDVGKTVEWGIVLNVLHDANRSSMMDYAASLSVEEHFRAPPGSITLGRCPCRAEITLKNVLTIPVVGKSPSTPSNPLILKKKVFLTPPSPKSGAH